ncbi:MAG: AAA family ATPase, partial [Actinomycetota bacterium]|nr:AAA family ATPase [Actinomycetota bacterium]
VEGVLTSGRGVELVVGVAGSGKTTALATVRDAFETAGFEVVGTSTSGQAARTLQREAGIEPSRTLASLNWRITHNSLKLTPNHVAVLDEAAMTDDAALVGFLEAARTTGAKVVAVGDPRQLGSVGPGGGFEAVANRFGAAVHVLSENVRQRDPAERTALAQLRSGDVDAAVAFYAAHGRICVSADRDTALDDTVAGWAADIASGADAAMYAWRRANVAELNRRGRTAWEAMGRLSGKELTVGQVGYRAGDRIVTLAPGANGEIVTSETGTVLAVDVEHRELAATMADGRLQRFASDDLDAAHLAHGYAVTVHRSQGATVARAHPFEDGGGRELAYVKMSRATEHTTVHTVADSHEQAVEDLARSWSVSRRIGWAIDRGTPAPGADRRPDTAPGARERSAPDRVLSATLRHAHLVAEREALVQAIPTDPRGADSQARGRLQRLEAQHAELEQGQGWGVWQGTAVGNAAKAWSAAYKEWQSCLARAETAGWREAAALRRRAAKAAKVEPALRERFDALAAPQRARIEAELPEARRVLDEVEGRSSAHLLFSVRHPEARGRLDRLDDQIATAAYELDLERHGLDGVEAKEPRLHHQFRGLEREAPGLDRGMDLGMDLGL